ncbi:hypothetical protein BDA96_10G050700 [Sorghum bicolor]|uniref:Bowman-Birk serine protease inhibitors family domain-containing protein n=2 Tax=Sorghum bicolor TaxID=4558 RepID=A0A921Q310_SORBI|nr:hypothetical protein BDA96_10G050700 [Sorghum bicolor]OQU75848.1 hypothetical protein SORBI_3010G043350 [Sorghum bicolor]
MLNVVAILLFLLVLSPANCRPYQLLLEAKSRISNTSANNATMIPSTADGNTADCDLVFCGEHRGCTDGQGNWVEPDQCYCCEPNPDRYNSCYSTRSECRAHCPFCKTT